MKSYWCQYCGYRKVLAILFLLGGAAIERPWRWSGEMGSNWIGFPDGVNWMSNLSYLLPIM